MSWKYVCCLAVAAGLAVVGCGPTGPGAQVAESQATGSASPSENYKQQRAREAIEGLSFESGVVKITPDSAKIARRGTAAQAIAQAEKAEKLRVGNDYWGAIGAYRTAVLIGPDRADSYLGLGRALMTEGRVNEAMASFATVLKMNPKSLAATRELAMATETFGDFTKSADAWRRVLALDSRQGDAHYRLAVACFYTNDVTGAIRHTTLAEQLGFQVPPQFNDLVRGKAAQNP